jgi:EmrB/QacA subfamily drug resistance transporter
MSKKIDKEIEGIPADIYKRRWRILGILCTSLLIVMLANSGLNLALPSMSKDLGLTSTELVWVVDIYSLIFASLLFTMGTLGDRFGRKGIMQIGQVIFLLAAGYAAFVAKTGVELIAARGVMGIGAAMVMPSTLSIVTNVFPKSERARAIGIWSGIAGGGIALGSIVSGFLLQYFNWQATFVLSIVIGIVSVILNRIYTPTSKDAEKPPIDIVGGILSIVGLLGLVYGIIEAPSKGLAETDIFLSLGIGIVTLIAFVFWELHTKHPMLDVRLFKDRAFGISTLSLLLVFFSLMGVFFSLSQLYQLIIGYSPLESSIRMLPVFIIMIVAAPLSPSIVKRIGVRWTVSSGLAFVSIGFLLMSGLPVAPTYIQLLLTLVVVMIGMSLTMSPTTNMLMSSVPKNKAGMGSAMNDTTRELGGALGVAVLGAVLGAAYTSKIHPFVANLPEQAQVLAEKSLAGAFAVGAQLGPNGAELIQNAKAAWMHGLSEAMVIAAIISGVSAVIAAIWLPHTHIENADDSFADTLELEVENAS